MASRKSLSSAPSASRADPAAAFRRALDRAAQRGQGSLQAALMDALVSKPAQRAAQALVHTAEAAVRVAREDYRPERLTAPSEALPPLP